MFTISVGWQAPPPFWPAAVGDSTKFVQGIRGDWAILIYLRGPSGEERQTIGEAEILSPYLTDDSGSMVMALIRFGGTEIIYELIHDPTRYPAMEWGKRAEMWDMSNMVTILLIDSTNGVVGAMRYVNMPKVFWQVWRGAWRKALSIEDYSTKYAAWIEALWQHKTLDLWEMGTPAGVFGEKYDLREVMG